MKQAHERGPDFEKAEGLAIAQELAAAIAALARGLHVMPMGRYTLVGEILESVPRPTALKRIG
jgi:5,10-methylenetetrahydrofolate reductase